MTRRARHKATRFDRERHTQTHESSSPDAEPGTADPPLEADGEPQFAQQDQSTPA